MYWYACLTCNPIFLNGSMLFCQLRFYQYIYETNLISVIAARWRLCVRTTVATDFLVFIQTLSNIFEREQNYAVIGET